jgi:hypothetical protein
VLPALLLLFLATHAHGAPCTEECWVDATGGDDVANEGTSPADAFATIGKGIATVEIAGTVHVAAGLYEPNFTDVPKSVVLLGAQAGVDPTLRDPTDAATESIVRSNTGFRVTGEFADVTIDGFSFQEKTAGLSTAITTGSGASDVSASVKITRNVFAGMTIGVSSILGVSSSRLDIIGNRFAAGGTAVQVLGDRGESTLTITGNRLVGLTNRGVDVAAWIGATIADNVVQDHAGALPPISIAGCDACVVERNTIDASTGGNAIRVIGSNGASTDCLVRDNTVTDPAQADSYAIFVGDAERTIVDGNTITGARAGAIVSNPASMITRNSVASAGEPGSVGIYLRAANTGSQVSGNTISGAAVGVDIDPAAGSSATTITGNLIVGNDLGIGNRAATLAIATCNWWGDASGPSGSGGGIGDAVSANVEFMPWDTTTDVTDGRCFGMAVTTTTSSTTTTTTLPMTPCPATPRGGCASATKAALVVKDNAKSQKDALVWSWQGGPVTADELGSPLGVTGYTLCFYDGASSLRLDAALPPAGTCAGKACWKAKKTGFAYKDKERTADGVTGAMLRAGAAGKARMVVKAKGTLVVPPSLPLVLPARVQLLRIDGTACWEATFVRAKKNVAAQLKARTP